MEGWVGVVENEEEDPIKRKVKGSSSLSKDWDSIFLTTGQESFAVAADVTRCVRVLANWAGESSSEIRKSPQPSDGRNVSLTDASMLSPPIWKKKYTKRRLSNLHGGKVTWSLMTLLISSTWKMTIRLLQAHEFLVWWLMTFNLDLSTHMPLSGTPIAKARDRARIS